MNRNPSPGAPRPVGSGGSNRPPTTKPDTTPKTGPISSMPTTLRSLMLVHYATKKHRISPQMITAAKNYLLKKNLLAPSLLFVRSDCRRLPYADGTFDLDVSSYLFDLLPKIRFGWFDLFSGSAAIVASLPEASSMWLRMFEPQFIYMRAPRF
jgi:hypothetical protein